MNIALVSPQNVDAVWQHIAEMVSNGMDQITADCTAGDLWTLCRSGQVYLVIAHDQKPVAASFWRFEMWPAGGVFKNLMTVGEHHRKDDWFADMDRFVNRIAQSNGASLYAWQGPRAWGRLLPKAQITTCNYIMEVRADG